MIGVDDINKLQDENIKLKKLLLRLKEIALKDKLYKGFHYGYIDISNKLIKELDRLEIKL